MKGNFIRINNMLLEKESESLKKIFVQNETKNYKFLTFFQNAL